MRAANEMGGLSEAVNATAITTGINELNAQPVDADQPIYNLQGIRVKSAKNGLYIVGGKKVTMK